MTLAPGTRLGQYEILAQIGAGGMGEVFRAKDSKLGRDVAIKVLPEGFAADSERLRRFQQEARTLAALSHPNVVQVHDAGEHEGRPYLVMELLEGETLRQRLAQGRLPWRKAVEFAAAISDGLAAAHAKGIIHRDLKPENLVLTEHGLKILDFGLAKQWPTALGVTSTVETETAPPGTMDGALLGTVGYMSPEQVQRKPADARSDMFSLGCVLYEMVTGKRAFARDSTMETLAAILKDPVPEPSISGSGGTPELDRIIGHCLEKSPGDRFHSAKDLAFDLRTLLTSAPTAVSGASANQLPSVPKLSARRSLFAAGIAGLAILGALLVWSPWKSKAPPYDPRCVAILPFENHTGDPAFGSLGQQVVDLVRQNLQQADNLKVATDVDLPSGSDSVKRMAEVTKARFVAAGAYYLRGGEVELQARLVDPWAGKTIYTLGPWRGPAGDPAKALEDLCQGVSGAIAWSFIEGYDYSNPGMTHAPRLDAFLVWNKGRKALLRDNSRGQSCFEQAQNLDPDFTMAKLDLVFAHFLQGRDEDAAAVLLRMETDRRSYTAVEGNQIRWWKANLEGRNLEVLQADNERIRLLGGKPALLWQRAEDEIPLSDYRRPSA